MDLEVYARVIWRFRVLVLAGTLLAVALAVLSVARVSFVGGSPSVAYRQAEVWSSRETILLTQPGFPWGRTVFPQTGVTGTGGAAAQSQAQQFADPGRFYQLAALYAQLAGSDQVRAILYRQGPANGVVSAAPAIDPTSASGASLPFVNIIGSAMSPTAAQELAHRGTVAFETFLREQQNRAAIPASQRVEVEILNHAMPATLVSGRKKTTPIAVFLAVLIATLGAAFILENLRPRIRAVQAPAPAEQKELRVRTPA